MKKTRFFICICLGLLLAGLCIGGVDANAASGFKYKDYLLNKTVKYTGTVPSYTINDEKIDMKGEPALISDRGIAYASAKALFQDNLGMTVKYSKSKKQISFQYMGHTLLMYIGETRAIFDGVEVEAPCAPFRIKYKKSKKVATMVPSRFVTESFDLGYVWDSDTSTVSISVPYYYGVNGVMVKYSGTKGKITFEGKKVNLHKSPSFILSDIAVISTKSDLFKVANVDFEYDKDTGLIRLKHGVHTLHLCVGSKIAYVDGMLDRCGYEPTIFYIPEVNEDILYLPGRFTMESLGFKYVWNSDTGTSVISLIEEEIEKDKEDEKNGTDENEEIDNEDVDSNEDIKDNNGNVDENNKDNDEDTDENVKKNNKNIEVEKKEEKKVSDIDSVLDKKDNEKSESESMSEDQNDSNEPESNEVIEGTGIVDDSTSEEDVNDEDEASEDVNTGLNAIDEVDFSKYPGLIKVVNTVSGYSFYIDKENCAQTLELPVPKGIKAEDIEINEDLLGCKTELVLKGNYSKFYKKAIIENTGEAILQLQIYYDSEANETKIILYSDVVLGCGLTDTDNDRIIEVRMDFVKNIYKKVIVLDAGHGDHDPGAQHGGINEKDLNLKIVLNCRELFKKTDIKVYYTRTDDTFVTLYDRADFAELVGADMFISVHHNSSDYKAAKGTSVHYSLKDTYTSLNGLTSEILAQKMLDSLTAALETRIFSEGLIPQNFVVVRDSKAPAVLLEIGFMSNSDELSKLKSDKFSKKAAKAIFNTVLDIYEEAM